MEVLAWIFVGIVVGIIAKLLLRDYSAVSWILTIILSVVGGFVSAAIVLATDNRWEIGPVSTTIAGAVGVLMVHRIFEKY
jgi:uncharacterized membrane protein YeaQ/YmgE (transglycosylase-associated protein family)